MMLFVLGTMVVKGVTSVRPLIKTDNTEMKQSYSCETIGLSSEAVVIQEIGLPIDSGNFIPKGLHKFIANKEEEKVINFVIEDINYLPDLINENGIKNYLATTKRMIAKRIIAKSSGGLPYNSIVLS